jgi:hypothetical protein
MRNVRKLTHDYTLCAQKTEFILSAKRDGAYSYHSALRG